MFFFVLSRFFFLYRMQLFILSQQLFGYFIPFPFFLSQHWLTDAAESLCRVALMRSPEGVAERVGLEAVQRRTGQAAGAQSVDWSSLLEKRQSMMAPPRPTEKRSCRAAALVDQRHAKKLVFGSDAKRRKRALLTLAKRSLAKTNFGQAKFCTKKKRIGDFPNQQNPHRK